MKKNYIKSSLKVLIGVTALAFASSCNDFLTIYPTNSVVLENYWKEKGDVEGMVNNCYRTMAQKSFMEKLLVWGEIRSENVIEGVINNSNIRNINEANLLSTNGYCSWADFYKVINNCNIVLKYAPEVVAKDPNYTQGDCDVHCGEMLALRALCHFYLVRTFRDIPLLTEAMIDDSQNLYSAQVTPIEALDCIIADLEQADKLVMKSGNYATNEENKGRITRDAVRTILADALLWKAAFTQYQAGGNNADAIRYYDDCIQYCDSVINARKAYLAEQKELNNNFSYADLVDEKYPIVPSFLNTSSGNVSSGNRAYTEIFGTSGQNSIPESIFEIQFINNDNVEEQNYVVPEFYGREQGAQAYFASSTYLSSSADGNLYDETDIRRPTFVNTTGGEEDIAGITKFTAGDVSGTFTGRGNTPLVPAYRTARQQGDQNKAQYQKYYIEDCNWIVYRMTDVMLMKAEALAQKGDTASIDAAFDLVKAVYYRSNNRETMAKSDTLTYTIGNAADMQAMVMKERQRELVFEGKRWYDIVRKALYTGEKNIDAIIEPVVSKKYSSNHKSYISKMPTIDYMFFPIEEREIDNNPLLVQNPAYETESIYEKK